MAYVKKISKEEFIEMVINKELEIANADVRYKDIVSMSREEQDEFEFWTRYTFKTLDVSSPTAHHKIVN